jgi:hypothetical protein
MHFNYNINTIINFNSDYYNYILPIYVNRRMNLIRQLNKIEWLKILKYATT